MLKIFSDSNYLKPENRTIIFPLLFDLHYRENSVMNKYYKMVSEISKADIVIVSIDVNSFMKSKTSTKWLNDFIENANSLNKKTWIYTSGDYGISIKKQVYTFRFSGFDSKLNDFTFLMPSFINNPYDKLQTPFYTIKKQDKPSIGFVGNANGSVKKIVSEFILYSIYCYKRVFKIIKIDKQFFYPSSYKRFNFLKQLSENKKVKTDFIFREKYRAGIKSEAEKIKTSKEFSENMLQNPYTFCLRGAGNFSVRLYETLAMGRIPVVIKTDFRLPLQSFIYWEKHCVLLNQDNFVTDFIDFHNQITSSDFELMQINNLKLWNEFLNRESYFKQISAIFESKILNHD